MIERPRLLDEEITSRIREAYGLEVIGVKFLPIGHDFNAWVYRLLLGSGEHLLLKVRRGEMAPISLELPHYLKHHGVTQVVAPVATTIGELWAELADFAMVLFPFIEGAAAMETGLTEAQWVQFGALARSVHECELTAELRAALPKETFTPEGVELLPELDALAQSPTQTGALQRELAAFWLEKRETIHAVATQAKTLGDRLRLNPPPSVVCHADLHLGNLIADRAGSVHLIDWDNPAFAPRERDLMFVVDGAIGRGVSPAEQRLFFQGYGDAPIDPVALAYYRYAWAVQDIASFGADVWMRTDLGETAQREAIRCFRSLFDPNQIVAAALRSQGA